MYRRIEGLPEQGWISSAFDGSPQPTSRSLLTSSTFFLSSEYHLLTDTWEAGFPRVDSGPPIPVHHSPLQERLDQSLFQRSDLCLVVKR